MLLILLLNCVDGFISSCIINIYYYPYPYPLHHFRNILRGNKLRSHNTLYAADLPRHSRVNAVPICVAINTAFPCGFNCTNLPTSLFPFLPAAALTGPLCCARELSHATLSTTSCCISQWSNASQRRSPLPKSVSPRRITSLEASSCR